MGWRGDGVDGRAGPVRAHGANPKTVGVEELARRYASTRGDHDLEALCAACLSLVRGYARKIARQVRRADLEDLIADGAVGLLRAARSFDARFGRPFGYWLQRHVRGEVFNGLRRVDALDANTREFVRSLDLARWKLAQERQFVPTLAQTGRALGLNDTSLRTRLVRARCTVDGNAVEIDRMAASPGGDPSDVAIARVMIRRGLAVLDAKERMVIRAVHGGGATRAQIGRGLGVSRQYVKEVHDEALRKMREALGADVIGTAA